MKARLIAALALASALPLAPAGAADTISATHVFPASLVYSRSFLDFVKKANAAGKGEFTSGEVHARSAQVLKPGAALVFLNAAPRAPVHRTDVRVRSTEVRATPARLRALLTAKLRVPIESRFPLQRAAEAYELSRSEHARGKIVLQIG